jgi:2-polyprenyl-3-methyl-5-hydroxy-6-metoxy-1,4-benzoquinol methylase
MRPGLQSILDLGVTPLANALLSPGDQGEELRVPLHLVFCPSCSLLQIDTTVRPDVLFRNYVYRSSFSDAFLRHAQEICTRVIAEHKLGPGQLVVEVASNDGYLLKNYKRAGIPVLGIEPATNIARIASEEHGIPTVNEFFGSALAERLRGEGKRAQVIHANNVLAHVADLNGFVKGFLTLLADDGVVISESPYALDFIAQNEFDTIYHEHLCYYSLTALDHLFRRHGLAIIDAERIAVHGGSLRIVATPIRPGVTTKLAVAALLAEEAAWGVAGGPAYSAFAGRVARIRTDLVALLDDIHAKGKRIAAYGAAAKGATLLNYAGIGPGVIDFVADRSPLKHGKLMPGVRLPILPAEEIAKRQPDFLLLLAWNFADEIIRQQDAYRRAGGAFIVPIPAVQII